MKKKNSPWTQAPTLHLRGEGVAALWVKVSVKIRRSWTAFYVFSCAFSSAKSRMHSKWFYLARSEKEAEDKERACLGRYVWRMANGEDGLWDENVGPSCYAEAQGKPVKIWGMFGDGKLEYFVLPADGQKTTNMNGARYNALVKLGLPNGVVPSSARRHASI